MFSKKLAGIGAAAAVVGSALVPSVALAAPDPTPAPVVQATSVEVEKVVVDNSDIINDDDLFAFTVTSVTEDPTKDTDNPGGESGFKSSAGITLPIERLGTTSTNNKDTSVLPDLSSFTEAGIYEWIVAENSTIATSDTDTVNSKIGAEHTVRFDGVSYRLKAYVGVDPDYGQAGHPNKFMYKGITIVQLTNHFGVALDPLVKVEKMVFTNVYEDVPPDDPGDDPDDPSDDEYAFRLTKHVSNPDGATEVGSYEFEVTFGWPTNFDGDTTNTGRSWTGETPNIATSSGTCTPNAANKKTVCTVTLTSTTAANDKFATFTGVPVGATYKVVENTTGNFDVSYGSAVVDGSATVPAGGAAVTATNTYRGITPTGIMLAVLPYVLMIGIPLLAIAGYIALRRKMNL